MKCQLCDGPCVRLGTLGLLVHFRCRNCGMIFSKKLKPSKRRKAVRPVSHTSSK